MATAGSALKDFLRTFVSQFRDVNARAAGDYADKKTARILKNICTDLLDGETSFQPIVSDFSSGAWNVALHGVLLALALLVTAVWGLVVQHVWAGSNPTSLGFIGPIPRSFVAVMAFFGLLFWFSRYLAGWRGWAVFSFFIPNIDTANVIFRSKGVRALDPDRKKRKVEARRMRAEGRTRKLVVLAAHYDTARCLPPFLAVEKKKQNLLDRILSRLTKNGISVLPSAMFGVMTVLCALLAFLPSSPFLSLPWVKALVTALLLLAFLVILLEGLLAAKSSIMPYGPGFNDNLSGVAAALGIVGLLFPAENGTTADVDKRIVDALRAEAKEAAKAARGAGTGGAALPETTDVIAVFTGSEENGLRGSMEFTRRWLKDYADFYGVDNTFIVNFDSVSGEYLRVAGSEHNFAGGLSGGDKTFAEGVGASFETLIERNKRFVEDRFTEDERKKLFVKTGTGYRYAIHALGEPLQACTDITAFCAPLKLRNKAKAFTVIAPQIVKDGEGEIVGRPRHYHTLQDTYENLMDAGKPWNFASIAALAYAIRDWMCRL